MSVPKKPIPPMASEPWSDSFTASLSAEFGGHVLEFASYLGQHFIVCEPRVVIRLLDYLKLEHEFDYLVDLTAVDYPEKRDRFEVIYILYSFASNRRIRVKTLLAEGAVMDSAVAIYTGADWLEREVFDMFGIEFAGHPDLKRILLPDGWSGHPLKKDYNILQMDNEWVQQNLGIESGQ